MLRLRENSHPANTRRGPNAAVTLGQRRRRWPNIANTMPDQQHAGIHPDRCWPDVGSMLGLRQKRWHSIEPILNRAIPQQTQNICITFIQRRPNVFDVSPALYNGFVFVGTDWYQMLAHGQLNAGPAWITLKHNFANVEWNSAERSYQGRYI